MLQIKAEVLEAKLMLLIFQVPSLVYVCHSGCTKQEMFKTSYRTEDGTLDPSYKMSAPIT